MKNLKQTLKTTAGTAITILIFLAIMGTEARAQTGFEFNKECQTDFPKYNELTKVKVLEGCMAYIEGVIATSNQMRLEGKRVFCADPSTSYKTMMMKVFVQMEKIPKHIQIDKVFGVLAALSNAYPCNKGI